MVSTKQTTTVAGAVTGSVIGLVVGAPLFIGNVIAQEFGYTGSKATNMRVAALAAGPKAGHSVGEVLGTGVKEGAAIVKKAEKAIEKRIKKTEVTASDNVNFQEAVKDFQKGD